ncbi:hypothetical protein HK405_011663 [Cladochytrium tenue]|nr:hypothetical protein HK405_011663 [Cladochytrium tenue]
MQRLDFVPGQPARDLVFDANGHLTLDRDAALAVADDLVLPSAATHLYQPFLACLGPTDRVDVYFGATDPDPADAPAGRRRPLPSGELVGHTWAQFRGAGVTPTSRGASGTSGGDDAHTDLWEVGRATTPASDRQATRAFNALRDAIAAHRNLPAPLHIPVPAPGSSSSPTCALCEPGERHGSPPQQPLPQPSLPEGAPSPSRPPISRALSPSNLYFGSDVAWFFVDLSGSGGDDDNDADSVQPMQLTRPLHAIEALRLAALATLVLGRPPLVFAVRFAGAAARGRMPEGFIRAHYIDDERVAPTADRPLLVL